MDYTQMSVAELRQAAKELGISEPTMTRMMRTELPEGKRREIEWIINDIAIT